MAMTELSNVPKASAAIPNFGCASSGNQGDVVKKLAVFALSAGSAFHNRKTPMAPMTMSTTMPDPREIPAKSASRGREDLPKGAPTGASGLINVVTSSCSLKEDCYRGKLADCHGCNLACVDPHTARAPTQGVEARVR